jgi:predicted RNA-binding protein with PIN domain
VPYLIDGHNLIPWVPGLSLSDENDEAALVERLQRFAARSGRAITVYFDRAGPGPSRRPARSRVSVHFAASPETADAALIRHLTRLGRSARQWTVVSSDGEVRRAAQRAGAKTTPSRTFARLLGQERERERVEKPEPADDPESIDQWLSEFAGKRKKAGR